MVQISDDDRAVTRDGRAAACGGGGSAPVVVGITGGSGAGKTTLAERLLGRFGGDAVVIAHDDYYHNLADVPWREGIGRDFDCPEALDTALLVEHLCALVAGCPVEAPRFDFISHARIEGAHRIEPAPILLVEGLMVMCDPELCGLFDLTVFVDADPDVRALRRVERDCRERGIGLPEAVAMYLDTVKPAHEKYVEPCKGRADLVIDDVLDDRTLDAVVQAIEELRAKRCEGPGKEQNL